MHGLARLLTTRFALLVCAGTVGKSASAEVTSRVALSMDPARENLTAVTSPPLGNAIRRTDDAGGRLTQEVIEQWVQDAGNNAAPLERMRAVHDALGRPLAQRAEGLAATTYQYDRGTLAAQSFGEDVTTYHYDTAGRLAEERSPVRGRVVHYQYHPLGNVSQQVMHAGNEVTTLDFDKAGNVVAKTLPGDGPPWRYAHTATGLLLRVAPPGVALDAENQTYRYDYFADGLLSDVVAPEGPRRHYTYDGRRRPFHLDLIGEGGGDRTETWTWQGNVETHEGLGGWNTVTRYDGRGRPSLIEHARVGGALESFTAVTSRALRYGPFDGPVAIREVLTDFAGGDGLSSLPRNSTYTYDAAGRVRTATEPEGVIGYEYDLFQGHRRVVSTLPGGQTQGQILDSMGRVHQITLDEQVALTLEWNASGTLASITGRGRGLAESRSYDPAAPHRLTGIDIRREGAPVEAAPLVHLTYLHNFAAVGQVEPWLTVHRSDDGAPDVVSSYFVDAQLRLVKSEEDAVTRTYSWHADGRRDLEEVSAPGVEHSIRHGYDPFGQLEGLTRWTGPNEPAEYTVEVHSDSVGQVTDYADLETGLSRHLVWDAEGHLSTQVLTPAPALGQPASTWAYRYNARDQRVAKVAVGGPVAPTAYLWGAGGLLRESGVSTTDYVHGAGMILAAGGTRLAHDHLGSPIASLAENALNPETGTFDGWGRYFSGAAPNADGGSAPTTHVGYTGHAHDADSDLTYAEARWYDPDIGAFLSRDPVAGMLSEPGTLEPFGYVRGNPLFYVDPDGRYGSKAEQEAAVYLSYHDSASWSHESNREVGGAIYDEFLNACGGKRLCASRVAYLNKRDNFRSLEEAQTLGTLFARQEDHLAGDKNALAGLSSEGAAFVARGASDLRGGLAMVEAWGNDPLDPGARRRFFDEDNRDGAIYLAEQRQMHNSIAAGLTAAMAMPIGAAVAETYVGGAALTGLSGKQVYDDVQSGDVGPGTVLAAVGVIGGVAAAASEAGGALKAVANATKGKAPAATESASLATRLGCFAAGTEVLTSSGPVPIESVERGTGVACADPATGEWMTCEVTDRLEHFYEGDVVRIVVKGKALVATGNHPFWVSEGVALDERPAAVDAGDDAELRLEGGRWVEARALDAGDTLVLVGGAAARIDSIDHGMASLEVYNLRVADHHNYAVGPGGILVHNQAARNRSLPPPPRQVNASKGVDLLPNQVPSRLSQELADAAAVGVRPMRAGAAGFDDLVNEGTVKWVISESGELLVGPHSRNGVEISHAVLSGGRPVRAAGQADIAAFGGQRIGIGISPHSGHFMDGMPAEVSNRATELGRAAFEGLGVVFR